MKSISKQMLQIKERGHRRRLRAISKILIRIPNMVRKIIKIPTIHNVTKPRIKRYSTQERIDMKRRELGIIL